MSPTESIAWDARRDDILGGCADRVIQCFGVRQFIADVDRGREFWREGGVIGEVLSWIADEGFGDLCRKHGLDYKSASEFRQRHLVDAITAALKASAWR